jgi:hypothetical protein
VTTEEDAMGWMMENVLQGAEDFRRFCLRRRGRQGRYWTRRRPPSRMLAAVGVERGELGARGGGLFRIVNTGINRRER